MKRKPEGVEVVAVRELNYGRRLVRQGRAFIVTPADREHFLRTGEAYDPKLAAASAPRGRRPAPSSPLQKADTSTTETDET
jgi:hypothetical protein